jgi:hypothetical protein
MIRSEVVLSLFVVLMQYCSKALYLGVHMRMEGVPFLKSSFQSMAAWKAKEATASE